MKQLFQTLLDGLRAVFLRWPHPAAVSAPAGLFFALIGVFFVVRLVIELVDTPAPWQFDARGVPALLADALLVLLAAWLLAALARRRDIVWGAAASLLAAAIANEAIIEWPADRLAELLVEHDQALPALVLAVAARAWWFIVLAVFAHWLAPRRRGGVLVAAVLAYAVSAAAWWWLPASPLLASVAGAEQEVESPLPAEDDSDETVAPTFDPEEVMFNQRALLDAALAKLRAPTPGRPDLYVVAFAGDAAEAVFRHEVEYAERLFAQRFDADGRVLVLENNAATTATRPLATWTNLHYALQAIAQKIDPAEDIVLLYLTTHGSEDHQLLVDLDPLPLDQIEPKDLADALRTTPGIRWKVIVVNACYSGGFIDALRDDSTMVISSARADRTSFGCGVESDITYFGRAFLVDALNRTTSLREAFDLATQSVTAWEAADKEEHSEPQIASSAAIEAKLAAWRKQLPERPAVPFAPAAATP